MKCKKCYREMKRVQDGDSNNFYFKCSNCGNELGRIEVRRIEVKEVIETLNEEVKENDVETE